MIVLLLGLLFAAGAQAAEYSIAGVVMNPASGQALRGVQLSLSAVGQGGQSVKAVSSADGEFAFRGLPQGKYQLSAHRRGFLDQVYGLRPPAPTVIAAGAGLDTGHILFQFAPPAAISGKVIDEEGEPVEHAVVELLSSKVRNGRRQSSPFAVASTNDIGEYRFSLIPPGTYYMAVSGYPWFSKFNELVLGTSDDNPVRAGYGLRYYPNVSDPSSAAPLVVQAGQEANADFSMLPVPAVAVNIQTENGEANTKQYKLIATGIGGNRVVIREASDAEDNYTFYGVPPGRYTAEVQLSDATPILYGRTEIDVGNADAEASLSLLAAPTVTATVETEAGIPDQSMPVLYEEDTGRAMTPVPGSGGRFAFPAVPPGRYRVGLYGSEDAYLKSWSAGSAHREDQVVDIPEGSTVRLKLVTAKGAARVEGKSMRGEAPAPGVLVVLAPSAAAAKPEDYRAYRSDTDGSFQFRGVPPGAYSLFAVDDGADLEYANPSAILPYLASAHKLRVERAGSYTEKVEVAAAGH